MASELTKSTTLRYSKGGAVASVDDSVTVDITTGRKTEVTQVVGTTEESLALVDVSSVEELFIKNLDATNYVEIGTVSGAYPIKLKPGRSCSFPPNQNALYLKANTSACLVHIVALNS